MTLTAKTGLHPDQFRKHMAISSRLLIARLDIKRLLKSFGYSKHLEVSFVYGGNVCGSTCCKSFFRKKKHVDKRKNCQKLFCSFEANIGVCREVSKL